MLLVFLFILVTRTPRWRNKALACDKVGASISPFISWRFWFTPAHSNSVVLFFFTIAIGVCIALRVMWLAVNFLSKRCSVVIRLLQS